MFRGMTEVPGITAADDKTDPTQAVTTCTADARHHLKHGIVSGIHYFRGVPARLIVSKPPTLPPSEADAELTVIIRHV